MPDYDREHPFRWVLTIRRSAGGSRPAERSQPKEMELDYQALQTPPITAREFLEREGAMPPPLERSLAILRPAKAINWVYVRQSWLRKCPKTANRVEDFLLAVDDFAFELQKEADSARIEDNSFALEAAIILRFHAWNALSLLQHPEVPNAVARLAKDLMKLYNAILHPIQQVWDGHVQSSAEGGRESAKARAKATNADDGLRSRIVTKYRELRDSGKEERSIAGIVAEQCGCTASYVRTVAKEKGLR